MSMLVVLCIVATATGCTQMNVYSDFDHDADFERFQTYRWLARDQAAGVVPLYDKRIRTRVDQELAAKGFREVKDGEPDLVVSYEASLKERIQVRTADYYWPGYYPEVDRYQQGTLIIDLVDATINQLVWRGTATGVFDENPQKADEQLAKAITSIFKRYPPKD